MFKIGAHRKQTQKNHFASQRGLHAEQKVCEYFLEKGYNLKQQRKKIFGVEFDLIFEKQDLWVYIEVKSVCSVEFYLNRWPQRQKQRFLRVASILGEKKSSTFFLALVDYQNNIHLFHANSET